MTCKDCYHYAVCHLEISLSMGTDYVTDEMYNDMEKRCESFKDKSKIFELPCKVGDKVYKVIRSELLGSFVQEMTIREFGLFVHTNFEMLFGMSNKMSNNRDVFFDRSEAEARAKELNEK